MSFFIKFALAILVIIGLVGGGVYYGTNGDLGKLSTVRSNIEKGGISKAFTPAKTVDKRAPARPKIALSRIMPMLMLQTEQISNENIKDQAYSEIVNYSVAQRQFKFADAAMLKIQQAEWRDTARSKIAIGLALDGRADDAFKVIDAVEIDTLRDVMRLQVIEALIVPQYLPPGSVQQ